MQRQVLNHHNKPNKFTLYLQASLEHEMRFDSQRLIEPYDQEDFIIIDHEKKSNK